MKRFATYGLVALGILFVAAVAGVFSSVRALAQTTIRAALVKNVDERGRVPYQAVAADFSEACAHNGSCRITLPSVPLGKRLVIEYVNGELQAEGATAVLLLDCRPLSGCSPDSVYFDLHSVTGAKGSVSATLLAFAEEGAQPTIEIGFYASTLPLLFSPAVTVTGYLIDKTN